MLPYFAASYVTQHKKIRVINGVLSSTVRNFPILSERTLPPPHIILNVYIYIYTLYGWIICMALRCLHISSMKNALLCKCVHPSSFRPPPFATCVFIDFRYKNYFITCIISPEQAFRLGLRTASFRFVEFIFSANIPNVYRLVLQCHIANTKEITISL